MDYPIICNSCGYPPWLYADHFRDLAEKLHDPTCECPHCHGHDFSLAIGARIVDRSKTDKRS
jgi:Zn finger protein HypA/HybF involved in hydrogenase expression